MGRKTLGGVRGGSGIGGLNATDTTLTAAEDKNITVDPQGTGIFEVAGDQQLQAQGDLRFADADSSNYVAFQAPATVSSNVTWTLPSADASVADQALVSDSAGTLSFATTFASLTDNNTDATSNYILFGTETSGKLLNPRVNTAKLKYTPSTGEVEAPKLKSTGTLTAAGITTVTNSTASSSTSTGALVVTGGVGVGGTLTANALVGDGSGITNIPASGRLLSMNVYSRANPWDNVNSDLGATWTRPSGCNSVLVYVTGGGGGGRLNDQDYRGAPGGAGGTAIKWITGVAASVAVTVGGGGGYARNGGQGTNGRTSSFGGYCSASGGGGGQSDYWYYGGEGGSASGGDVNIYGGGGSMGHGTNHEGPGGASFWGGGRRGTHVYQRGNNEGESLNGRAWGSGGANGYYSQNISSFGANGAAGIVVVFNYT